MSATNDRSSPPAGAQEALAWFDGPRAVDTSELHGRWSGTTLPTGHPLDGALERFGWQG